MPPVLKQDRIGKVILSALVSENAYSSRPSPLINTVVFYPYLEVAIIKNAHLVLPSEIGLDKSWDILFDNSKEPVAGYVSQRQYRLLAVSLRALAIGHIKKFEVKLNGRQGVWKRLRDP
jgi:hypothetical protein